MSPVPAGQSNRAEILRPVWRAARTSGSDGTGRGFYAEVTSALSEAFEQQAATADVLSAISRSDQGCSRSWTPLSRMRRGCVARVTYPCIRSKAPSCVRWPNTVRR